MAQVVKNLPKLTKEVVVRDLLEAGVGERGLSPPQGPAPQKAHVVTDLGIIGGKGCGP